MLTLNHVSETCIPCGTAGNCEEEVNCWTAPTVDEDTASKFAKFANASPTHKQNMTCTTTNTSLTVLYPSISESHRR